MVLTIAPIVLIAFAVSVVLTPLLRYLGHRHGLLDQPNERSSHSVPTPRTGGVAIVAAILIAAIAARLWSEEELAIVLACAAAISILGAVDDVRTLGAGVKFVVHALAALAVITGAGLVLSTLAIPLFGTVALSAAGIAITLLWIVGFTNAYNFMDGINGIAALQAIVAATTYSFFSAQFEDASGTALAVAVAAAAAGFLFFNFPSGSIFMGDVGSGTVGFLLACEAVRVSKWGVPFIAAVLPLTPFVFDTAVTLLRRILRGERFYAAHRSHFYQRLTTVGWSHAAVTLLWSALAVACSLAAVAYLYAGDAVRVAIVVIVLAVHAAIAVAITAAEARRAGSLPGVETLENR